MDYGRPDLADRLAAEYVAGTLRDGARRRFESLLPAHALLRSATQEWQDRLMPLTAVLAPIQPSGEVWRRVSERIEGGQAKAAPSAWQRLSFWRGLSAFASVAAIGLAVLLANPGAVPPPVVVVLAATNAVPGGAQPASLVASISGDGATLVARPIVPVSVQADRSLELWAVPKAGAPDFMSTLLVKPPYATGAPGRTSCVKAMPASASAFCCATAPTIVTGAIAPASVNGVITMI